MQLLRYFCSLSRGRTILWCYAIKENLLGIGLITVFLGSIFSLKRMQRRLRQSDSSEPRAVLN